MWLVTLSLGHRDVPGIMQSEVGGRWWIATMRLDGRSPNYQLLITAASWRRQYQKQCSLSGYSIPQSKANIPEAQEPPRSCQGIGTSPLPMPSCLRFWAPQLWGAWKGEGRRCLRSLLDPTAQNAVLFPGATAWSLDVKQVYSVSVCHTLRFWGRLWEIGVMWIVGPVIVQSQRLTIARVHSSFFTEGRSFTV